ncbi:hypothetical protein HMPREF9123_2602 [Neisseria bacilliformis ATCC BAA-1200]|uniref:Uncharacterized protein n=1 Tax=Neisseria bacilliformis ATCC BAA-1200 TaxID=888742 RepID=F2BFU5_9NEIS|nr:hypothetical protein HMPREF9123_2602 [Neisseria bacilliformis ATCC BAA-1200]
MGVLYFVLPYPAAQKGRLKTENPVFRRPSALCRRLIAAGSLRFGRA